MTLYYPAEIVAVDADKAVARLDATGHQISFFHESFNALPKELRRQGARGFVSFPKAPPVFTADQSASARNRAEDQGALRAA